MRKGKIVKKTRSNCFGCYFYENNVSDGGFAKRIVYAAKNVIFSRLWALTSFSAAISR